MQHGVGAQLGRKLKHCDAAADAGKVDGGLYARVASAYDGHVAPLVERPVAVGAERHAAPNVLRLALDAEPAPRRPGGNDHGRGHKRLAALGLDALQRLDEVGSLDAPVGKHLDGVSPYVLLQRGGKRRSRRRRHRDKVLYAHRVVDLAAYPAGHHGHAEALASRVYGSRGTGRPSADHHHVEAPLNRFGLAGALRPVLGLELVEQHPEVAAAHMQQLSVGKDRRHALYAERRHLVLPQPSVNNLVLHVGAQQRHNVEGLHHVGAVGAR